jgi:peptidoglycan/LPS O-acetylase OafA/YrhL
MERARAFTAAPHVGSPDRRLDALTGLRFFAALAVLLFHEVNDHFAKAPPLVVRYLNSGFMSVSLFFVLSGFILTYNYLTVERRGSLQRPGLWAARFARIYPVYLLGLVLGLLPFIHGLVRKGESFGSMLLEGIGIVTSTVMLVQAWIPRAACRLNCPGWSLSVEVFFYLVFPTLGLLLVRLRGRQLFLALAATWVVSVGLLAAAWLGVGAWSTSSAETVALWRRTLRFFPVLRLAEFAFGILAGLVFLERRNQVRPRGISPRVLVLAGLVGLAIGLPIQLTGVWKAVHQQMLLPLFGVLIYGLAYGRGFLARTLAAPRIVLLGEASYALYVLHGPVHAWLGAMDRALGTGFHGSSWWVPVYAVVTVVVSLASYHLLEVPARNHLKQWIGARLGARLPAHQVDVARDERHGVRDAGAATEE